MHIAYDDLEKKNRQDRKKAKQNEERKNEEKKMNEMRRIFVEQKRKCAHIVESMEKVFDKYLMSRPKY